MSPALTHPYPLALAHAIAHTPLLLPSSMCLCPRTVAHTLSGDNNGDDSTTLVTHPFVSHSEHFLQPTVFLSDTLGDV